jgi:hypothetical protein
MTGRLYTHLKTLSLQMGQRALVIAGGLRKEQKLQIIRQRFGVDVEWHEIDSDSQRDVEAIVNRIRSGRVGAVILLTGLMAHKVRDKIVQTCSQYNVPHTTADKGGTGSIEQAFNDLERRLARTT